MLPRHIRAAISDFITRYKARGSYDDISLFSLAQLISYGLHRDCVWAPIINQGSLQFSIIDVDSVDNQVNFVYDSISAFHHKLYDNTVKNTRSDRIQKDDALMCDLFNKIVAVVLVKSYDNTTKHKLKRESQLRKYSRNNEVLNGCLDLVYRYETSDQKHTLKALLEKYKLSSETSFTVKCYCIHLIHGESLKCSEIMRFFSSRTEQSNVPSWGDMTLSDFMLADPVPFISTFHLRCSPVSVTDVSFFSSHSDNSDTHEKLSPLRSSSECSDPTFDDREWSAISREIEMMRQMPESCI